MKKFDWGIFARRLLLVASLSGSIFYLIWKWHAKSRKEQVPEEYEDFFKDEE